MATGAQATERVAKPMGVSLTLVERAARILKEADADLWPKAKKGGGKGADAPCEPPPHPDGG
jgi:hypothetical protein